MFYWISSSKDNQFEENDFKTVVNKRLKTKERGWNLDPSLFPKRPIYEIKKAFSSIVSKFPSYRMRS